MIRIGIVGATGYTGAELIRLLINHPDAKITALTSERHDGAPISRSFPALTGIFDMKCESLKKCGLEGKCDVIFSALPHKEGMEVVSRLINAGKKVIDLSADFRLNDPLIYEKWYGVKHLHPELIPNAVYGLPELKRDSIKRARLVANPGCYPTGTILGIAPLLKAGWIEPSGIIVDSKSGTSGAGRNAGLPLMFPECNEGVKAYSVAAHRHTPEMEQEMAEIAGTKVTLTFSPHLVPTNRGILTTIYCRPIKKLHLDQALELFSNFYANEPFVRVLGIGILANTRHILGSNFCHIGLAVHEENNTLVITTALDNLIKGASGAAVQNMNIMLGIGEETGLKGTGLFP